MTVTTSTRKAGPTTGDGSTTAYSYDFKIDAESDLEVYLENTSTLARTLQVLNTDYTVTGEGTAAGGDVTFTTAPPSTDSVLIRSRLPRNNEIDITTGTVSELATWQEGYDRLLRHVQELQEEMNRCVRLSKFSTQLNAAGAGEAFMEIVDPTASEDGYFIYWDESNTKWGLGQASTTALTAGTKGTAILADNTTAQVLSELDMSAAVQSVLDDASVGAMRTTLEVPGKAVMIDIPTALIDIDQTDSPVAFGDTDIDITSHVTSGTAVQALLAVKFTHDTNAATVRSSTISFREKGLTPTTPVTRALSSPLAGASNNTIAWQQCRIGVDSSEEFEYSASFVGGTTGNKIEVFLEGYVLA